MRYLNRIYAQIFRLKPISLCYLKTEENQQFSNPLCIFLLYETLFEKICLSFYKKKAKVLRRVFTQLYK